VAVHLPSDEPDILLPASVVDRRNTHLIRTIRTIFPSQALNYLTANVGATFGYDNMYENEGPIGELDDEMFLDEQSDDGNGIAPNSIPLLPNDNVDEQTARDSETFGCDESKSTCFPLSAEPTRDHLYYEMFGFGANKKVSRLIFFFQFVKFLLTSKVKRYF